MVRGMKELFSNMALNKKIRLYFLMVVIQFSVVFVMLFTSIINNNKEYNKIVESATIASGFSIDFKNDFDYEMYRIIIGSREFKEATPYQHIEDAERVVQQLKRTSRTKGNMDRADTILKYLLNLKKHVTKIEKNLLETGYYDENIMILDNDIRVLTSLIQDTVLEYIYYETIEMENIRREMEEEMVSSIEYIIVILSVMVLIGFFFSFFIAKSISKPISQLSKITRQIAGGDLTVRSTINTGAEVKVLSDSLNIMVEKLSQLIDKVKQEQQNLREAELRVLQEQINPHFLYNTLDTIIWLAEGERREEVVEMVGALSKYFRTSLSKGNDLVTLRDEIIHISSYLQIQQIRYIDILDYEIHLPEELEQSKIPKITLQPLVENALYHGIKNKRGGGKIIVTASRMNDQILIRVTDNGMGMKEERLKEVEAVLKQQTRDTSDIYGIYNVNERIGLTYGTNFGLTIHSSYGEGTEVRVLIPLGYF